MIILHTKNGSHELKEGEKISELLPSEVCWVDMIDPTQTEESEVESLLKINIPTRAELRKNEALNRFFEERGAIFLSSGILSRSESDTSDFDVATFITTPKNLITCRYNKPRSFDNFVSWLSKHPEGFDSSDALFAGLLYAVCLRSAEILEKMGDQLEELSNAVLAVNNFSQSSSGKNSGDDLRDVLKKIGRSGSITIRLKESMDSLSRMASYYMAHRKGEINDKVLASLTRTSNELTALKEHVGFLASEINFLVNTTISLITVQQNSIIKIFSVAAVAFLPPTLIASIYGMNFQHMPELGNHFGYPLALIAMLISAVLPITYFKRKGWL